MNSKLLKENFNLLLNESSTVHGFFEEATIKYPQKLAIKTDDDPITYGMLNQKANKLARYLIMTGVEVEDVVAIQMMRSIDMLIAILAILKAGAAYLPIDINTPAKRFNYMLSNSNAKVLIKSDAEANVDIPVINVSKSVEISDITNLNIPLSSNNLAYIIYTSGSTGNPKGVMIEHGSAINRILWMKNEYSVSERDMLIQKTPYTFDVSVWELFLWFFAGASIYLYKQGEESNVRMLAEKIVEHQVTLCHFIPSMFSAFIKHIESKQLVESVSSLKHIFCSGEALNYELVQQFNNVIYPINRTKLHNLYGPTEATVDVTYFDCTGYVDERGITPIGKPISNTHIYIRNEEGQECRDGEVGELLIGGINVGRGYINLPELTAEKFGYDSTTNMTNYKTGDLARWYEGNIEFIGRKDNQIKIRGMRVEPEEIESVLMEHIAINKALVCTVDATPDYDSNYLVGIYEADEEIDEERIIENMNQKLPRHMVPSKFIRIKEIPLLPNGKIDRNATKKLLKEGFEQKVRVPNSDNQIMEMDDLVLKVIKKALNVNVAENLIHHLHDDLKVAGIDSLTFLSVIVKLEETFNIIFDNSMLSYTKSKSVQDFIDYVKEHTEQGLFESLNS